jgi:hypothetical protein
MKNIPCEPKETAMEMRLLTKGVERNLFAERVAEARARHGGLYKEICSQGTDNRPRLASANLYAMFENQEDPAEQMVAGIAMHNLEVFPQSCSKPDSAICTLDRYWSAVTIGHSPRVRDACLARRCD